MFASISDNMNLFPLLASMSSLFIFMHSRQRIHGCNQFTMGSQIDTTYFFTLYKFEENKLTGIHLTIDSYQLTCDCVITLSPGGEICIGAKCIERDSE